MLGSTHGVTCSSDDWSVSILSNFTVISTMWLEMRSASDPTAHVCTRLSKSLDTPGFIEVTWTEPAFSVRQLPGRRFAALFSLEEVLKAHTLSLTNTLS